MMGWIAGVGAIALDHFRGWGHAAFFFPFQKVGTSPLPGSI